MINGVDSGTNALATSEEKQTRSIYEFISGQWQIVKSNMRLKL
jgi:hypothetical protein